MKKNTIKKIRENHVKRRSMERFGIYLSRKDQEEIVRTIREGKAEFLKRESNAKKHFKVEYHGKIFRVVYNKKHRCLLTVLPIEFEE